MAIICLGLCAFGSLEAKDGRYLGFGGRRHVNHSEFLELPFGDDDMSYFIAYELHDLSGLWRIALNYTSSIEATDSVDYVLTPEVDLLVKDKMLMGGVGMLKSYIKDEISSDWTTTYWQLILAANFGMSQSVMLDVGAYYLFEEWKKVDEFDVDDLEYAASLKFSF